MTNNVSTSPLYRTRAGTAEHAPAAALPSPLLLGMVSSPPQQGRDGRTVLPVHACMTNAATPSHVHTPLSQLIRLVLNVSHVNTTLPSPPALLPLAQTTTLPLANAQAGPADVQESAVRAQGGGAHRQGGGGRQGPARGGRVRRDREPGVQGRDRGMFRRTLCLSIPRPRLPLPMLSARLSACLPVFLCTFSCLSFAPSVCVVVSLSLPLVSVVPTGNHL